VPEGGREAGTIGEVPRTLAPSLNVTVPVMNAEQLKTVSPAFATLVANVTVAPTVEGFRLDEGAKDTGRRLIVSVIEVVLAAVDASPE